MENLKKLVDAFGECGEAAAIYRGQNFLMVNDLFAGIFERKPETFEDLPILEVCHNDSIEMIRDFMHRRAIEDHGVPTSYSSAFITANQTKIVLNVIAIRLKKAEDSVLIIVRKS
jgi:PAS domain-containing protein